MYSTCLHCSARFPRNEAIEAMPIGRRLAFDATKGRLWVVCRSCERWNLTPFDERWEAVEQCEALFRGTRVRASTDNIGLARLRDGTELVRIGAPLRPEFAAWRYGDQFGRRRTRNALTIGGAVVGSAVALSGLAAIGAGVAVIIPAMQIVTLTTVVHQRRNGMPRTELSNGTVISPIGAPRLIEMPNTPEQWGIEIAYRDIRSAAAPTNWRAWLMRNRSDILGYAQVEGLRAMPLLRHAMRTINRAGASSRIIQEGVALIEDVGGPDRFAHWATTMRREWASHASFGDTGDLNYIPAPARLAFEMAVNEDAERRALEGELATLQAAWKHAEEIATIADNLLVAPAVIDHLEELRDRAKP